MILIKLKVNQNKLIVILIVILQVERKEELLLDLKRELKVLLASRLVELKPPDSKLVVLPELLDSKKEAKRLVSVLPVPLERNSARKLVSVKPLLLDTRVLSAKWPLLVKRVDLLSVKLVALLLLVVLWPVLPRKEDLLLLVVLLDSRRALKVAKLDLLLPKEAKLDSKLVLLELLVSRRPVEQLAKWSVSRKLPLAKVCWDKSEQAPVCFRTRDLHSLSI